MHLDFAALSSLSLVGRAELVGSSEENNFRGVTHGVITIKPIYGTTCAPLRWLARLSEAFRLKKWLQCETDPCLFRISSMGKVLGMAAVRVGDILVDMEKSSRFRFGEVVNQFHHIGISNLVPGAAATYLGLDLIALSDGSIGMSQKSFAADRLQLLEEEDYRPAGKALAGPPKRLSLGRQLIGSMIWMLQTRVDLSHRICLLSASMHQSVKDGETSFLSWIKTANKLVRFIKDNPLVIIYRSCLKWIPATGTEACLKLKLMAFPDASHCSLPSLLYGIPFCCNCLSEGSGRYYFAHGVVC